MLDLDSWSTFKPCRCCLPLNLIVIECLLPIWRRLSVGILLLIMEQLSLLCQMQVIDVLKWSFIFFYNIVIYIHIYWNWDSLVDALIHFTHFYLNISSIIRLARLKWVFLNKLLPLGKVLLVLSNRVLVSKVAIFFREWIDLRLLQQSPR